jgi:hypothetical protein
MESQPQTRRDKVSAVHRPGATAVVELVGIVVIVLIAALTRLPGTTERDMTGYYAWKNIRHFELAVDMRRTGNPLFGNLSWERPEVNDRWESRLTEAPFVTWLLIGAFALGGESERVLYIAFFCVAIMTHAAAYVMLRRHIGAILSATVVLVLAMVPVSAYYACHSIGENMLYSAQLFLLVATAAALTKVTTRRVAAVFLACIYAALCKLTTGVLFGATALCCITLLIMVQHRTALWLHLRRNRTLALIILPTVAVALGLSATMYFRLLHQWLRVGDAYFLQYEFYERLLVQARTGVGFWLMWLTAVATTAYVAMAFLAMYDRRIRLTPMEWGALILLVMTAVATALQGRWFVSHEYYLVTWVVPLAVIVSCAVRRVWVRVHPGAGVLALALLATALAADQPANLSRLANMYRAETLGLEERNALRRFFREKITTRESYFVISHAPPFTHHANVQIVYRWWWQDAIALLERTPSRERFLRELGIEYVVFPHYAIPEAQRDALANNVLLDLGDDHWKLGLVHMTRQLAIFRVCRGVAWRRALCDETEDTAGPSWLALSDGFSVLRQADGPPVFRSSARPGDRAALIIGPFVPNAEVLTYRASASHAPHAAFRVELGQNGEVIYRQQVNTSQPRSYVMDLSAARGRFAYLTLIDGHPWDGQLEVSELDLIAYEPLPWLSGGTEARDEP